MCGLSQCAACAEPSVPQPFPGQAVGQVGGPLSITFSMDSDRLLFMDTLVETLPFPGRGYLLLIDASFWALFPMADPSAPSASAPSIPHTHIPVPRPYQNCF